MTPAEKRSVAKFHDLYYWGPQNEAQVFTRTHWMGVSCEKCPLDLWMYQEMLFELRPDLIVETGTRFGGSAFFLAHMLDLLGHGEIITIDIDDTIRRPRHPRITYVHGSSADARLIDSLLAPRTDRTRLVILDSDHRKPHVLAELELFARYVTVGSYLIVEDTNINGHPVAGGWGDGPWEAVREFLHSHREFVIDKAREKFLLTFNPNGYLRRVPDTELRRSPEDDHFDEPVERISPGRAATLKLAGLLRRLAGGE